jgi:hypothetical protein
VKARPIAGEEIRQPDPDGPQFGLKIGNAGSAPLDAAHNGQQDVGEGLASIAVVVTLNLIARPRQQPMPGTLNARYHFRSPFPCLRRLPAAGTILRELLRVLCGDHNA